MMHSSSRNDVQIINANRIFRVKKDRGKIDEKRFLEITIFVILRQRDQFELLVPSRDRSWK